MIKEYKHISKTKFCHRAVYLYLFIAVAPIETDGRGRGTFLPFLNFLKIK